MTDLLDPTDRHILSVLQDGFPICERPFADVAQSLGIEEETLIDRVRSMCREGTLSRFGPLYNVERMGGAVTLAAMAVPQSRFDEVAGLVNLHPEVAHNYERDHRLNMWLVISTGDPRRIGEVIAAIESNTGLEVINLPKEREFFLGLRLAP